jgi:hypothetical protein
MRSATGRAVAAGIVLLTLVAGLAVSAPGGPGGQTPWADSLTAFDAAVERGNVAAAERALQSAFGAALGSRTWEGMVDVGDAYRRLAELPNARLRGDTRARDAYLSALFRARQQGSLDGVFRTAEGFAALGDREPVTMCIQVAKGLAARVADVKERERSYASVERMARRLMALETSTPD